MSLSKENLKMILLHEIELGRNAAMACQKVNTT
jgi:hypothetical protein